MSKESFMVIPASRALTKARRAMRNTEKNTKFTGEKPSLFLYGGVGLIALLKDLLDLVGIGSLPGIGTVVTLCLTFLIWMLLTLFDRSGGKGNIKLIRGLVVAFFGLVELAGFGLNFLPIETLMVFVLYKLAKRAWKKEEELAKKENRPSKSQLRQERLDAVRQAKEARAQRQIPEQQTEEPTRQSGDNGAKAIPSTPLKMMGDMKLPGNTVVPQSTANDVGGAPMMNGTLVHSTQVHGSVTNDSKNKNQQSIEQRSVPENNIAPTSPFVQTVNRLPSESISSPAVATAFSMVSKPSSFSPMLPSSLADNGAESIPSIPPKMMSDMKLSENTIAPKQEFTSDGAVFVPSSESQSRPIERYREQVANTEKTEMLATKEREVSRLLEKNVDGKYEKIVEDIRREKSDWVQSAEFARRIQLTGASSEDVEQIRTWVLGNLANGKVHIFEEGDIAALKEQLVEYSELESGSDEVRLEQGKAFYVNGNTEHLPQGVLNNVHVPESKFETGVYPVGSSTETILSHEIGHQAQDGLLESELYKDWKPVMKAGAPDPEYIGNIVETDARIRAMFRELKGVYDPKAGTFGEAEVSLIHKKQKAGTLESDTLDLLNHYDDAELIRIANILPAI